jgi:hypothetical protein
MTAPVYTYTIECGDSQVPIILANHLSQVAKSITKIQVHENKLTISTLNKDQLHYCIMDFFTARSDIIPQITSKCPNC